MPRRVIWARANRKHLFGDHPERAISEEEVEFVLNNAPPEDDH